MKKRTHNTNLNALSFHLKLSLLGVFTMLLFVIHSCTEAEISEDLPDVESTIALRDGEVAADIDIFNVGSCGSIFDIGTDDRWVCKDIILRRDTFTGIEPFPDCEFIADNYYVVCSHFIHTAGKERIFIQQSKFTSNCEEFLEWSKSASEKGKEAERLAVFNQIDQQIIHQLEEVLWIDEEFSYLPCDNHSHNQISWVKATCFSWVLFFDIGDPVPYWKKIACDGAGCCFRDTYFCKDENGDIQHVSSNIAMDEPVADCENSAVIVDSGDDYADTPCSFDCTEIE